MTEYEQIEEIAKLACSCFIENCEGCPFNFYPPCPPKRGAERVYNAGYRKQSEGEWIIKGEYLKILQCSACDCTAGTIYATTPFCPNCGAKMS